MALYSVARTVVFYFDVEAASPEQALEQVAGLGSGAAEVEELVLEEVVNVQETA